MKFYLRVLFAMVLFHALAYVYVVQLFNSRTRRQEVTLHDPFVNFTTDDTPIAITAVKTSQFELLESIFPLDCLERHRDEQLAVASAPYDWSRVTTNIHRLHASDYHFFSTLSSEFPHIGSCHFMSSVDEAQSLLNQQYYPITTVSCEQFGNLGRQVLQFYNASCSSSLTHAFITEPTAWRERSIRPWQFAGFLRDPNQVMLTYISIVPHAVIDIYGDVTSHNVSIVPARCDPMRYMNPQSNPTPFQLYKEVFSIHQVYGQEISTNTLENLIRLAPYIKFLQNHPRIMVHTAYRHPYLHLLGIGPERLLPVSSIIRASTLYLPAGTHCNTPTVFNTQLLRLHLRYGLFDEEETRKIIIMLKLSMLYKSPAYASLYDKVLRFTRNKAGAHGLRVIEFSDVMTRNLDTIRTVFNNALIVISIVPSPDIAHLIFSQPGTVLIEGVCQSSGIPNSQTIKFASFTQALGLRYHGVLGCTSSELQFFTRPIAFFIENKLEIKGKGIERK